MDNDSSAELKARIMASLMQLSAADVDKVAEKVNRMIAETSCEPVSAP